MKRNHLPLLLSHVRVTTFTNFNSMAKKTKNIDHPDFGSFCIVEKVSGGVDEKYIGQDGTITDVNRGVYSVIFADGKTQYFTSNELNILPF